MLTVQKYRNASGEGVVSNRRVSKEKLSNSTKALEGRISQTTLVEMLVAKQTKYIKAILRWISRCISLLFSLGYETRKRHVFCNTVNKLFQD